MTTIVYKDGVLACDMQCSYGRHCVAINKLVYHPKQEVVRAISGDLSCGEAAWESILKKEKIPSNFNGMFGQKQEDNPDFTIVYLYADGSLFVYLEGARKAYPHSAEYDAWGSGARIALGALYMGATPAEAVLASCKHDMQTGIGVMVATPIPSGFSISSFKLN